MSRIGKKPIPVPNGVQVTIVEFLDRMVPLEDEEVSKELARQYRKLGIDVRVGTAVKAIDESGDTVRAPNEGYTAGSQSIQTGAVAMRQACADVRALFLAQAAAIIGCKPVELSGHGLEQSFVTQPRLKPPVVSVTANAGLSSQDIFLTPTHGYGQSGAMILDPQGRLVWFHPVPKGVAATNLQVQSYRGAPVLTWWRGVVPSEVGVGFGRGTSFVVDLVRIGHARSLAFAVPTLKFGLRVDRAAVHVDLDVELAADAAGVAGLADLADPLPRPDSFALVQAVPPRGWKSAEVLTAEFLLALGHFGNEIVALGLDASFGHDLLAVRFQQWLPVDDRNVLAVLLDRFCFVLAVAVEGTKAGSQVEPCLKAVRPLGKFHPEFALGLLDSEFAGEHQIANPVGRQ